MPKTLKPNSKIGIVAPAGRIFRHELDFAIDWIEQNHWQAGYSEELFREHNFGYFYAGHDEHRLKLVQEALNNPDLDAIWFARGGYGSVRLIDQLDFTEFKKNPKWLIGYSDITVFHNHLNNLNIPTLHAVTAKQLNTDYSNETYETLYQVLVGEKLSYEFQKSANDLPGKAEGKLVGGNLSMLYSQLGSETMLSGDDLILFIEDWQENWYHLDRMMMALKRSGLFERVKGVIVGSFTKMDTREENPNYESDFDGISNQIIESFVDDLKIPVVFNFPAGHIGDNRALVLGKQVSFEVNDKEVLLEWLD
ncbi:LD-carboxypeptidase [Weeksellaceae bacterium KMM 9724]|uniref:S66 peptidase family protein n=1 Tax=Profundicola chukchiensis TaxID=2961959 RepID=UPI0024374EC8|nr:LD-carboxypeptidase [Profundicola chukchiensis]MDG4949586.1 LD-carboxypeptidase [Profundicola chukchiensis]